MRQAVLHSHRTPWLVTPCPRTRIARTACTATGSQHPAESATDTPGSSPPSKQLIDGSARMQQYLLNHTREPQVLADLRKETLEAMPIGARMLVPPEQGAFMAWLVRALGVRRALEVGVFTGYSSTAVALAMGEGGLMVACDRDPRAMQLARLTWERAGISHKIDGRLGQATEILQQLIEEGNEGSFDFAFIDADKRATAGYFEQCMQLTRVGGSILIDNVLFRGRVADPSDSDKKVAAFRDLNTQLLNDDRIDMSIVPVGDGLALCRKLK